jgi:hypothetical protein
MWPSRTVLTAALDTLVRPSFRLGGRFWPFYGLFVCSGMTAGVLFAIALARLSGISRGTLAVALMAGLLAAGALAFGTEILTGRELYTFYHYQLAVLAAGGATLAVMGRPALPCLDALGLALGLTQAFGRLGCFMAGCCHGRPHRWGVCYGHQHAEQGFDHALTGVRLFPIQAVESLSLFLLTATGTALMLSGRPAGSALTAYLAGYGTLRFGLELARGDSARPYIRGFSEAQWTAFAVLVSVVAAQVAGLLPLTPWPPAGLALVVLTAAGLTLHRRLRPVPPHRLLHPGHVSELAAILGDLSLQGNRTPRVACTSQGVRLSMGHLHGGAHYALSSRDGDLSEAAAQKLADLILLLRHPAESSRLLPGNHGVFHLLIETR